MAAIVDILIERPRKQVWQVIADNSTHPRWLGDDTTTEIEDGALAETKKFWVTDKRTGKKAEGEILSVKEPVFLKVRTDLAADHFMTTEYHLVTLGTQCVVRVVVEIYDTGDKHHAFFPEAVEQKWEINLRRLKDYCETT
jgi:uncharacterized protein YndB with AHSA1/START domain